MDNNITLQEDNSSLQNYDFLSTSKDPSLHAIYPANGIQLGSNAEPEVTNSSNSLLKNPYVIVAGVSLVIIIFIKMNEKK